MDFGLLIFATDYAIAPDLLAREAEAHGFESLFLPEHTHIPASRISPWPGGADLPRQYWHAHDPFVALSMAAAVTTDLKLGTGISLVTERDPILMAKQVASLDFLSNGRVQLGVGAGWNAEEMENHGTPLPNAGKSCESACLRCGKFGPQKRPSFTVSSLILTNSGRTRSRYRPVGRRCYLGRLRDSFISVLRSMVMAGSPFIRTPAARMRAARWTMQRE